MNKKIKLNSIQDNFDFALLQKVMWRLVGIERNKIGLEKALNEINRMQKNDLTFLSKKIIESALNRKESRGCHYRTDFLETKNKAEHSIIGK